MLTSTPGRTVHRSIKERTPATIVEETGLTSDDVVELASAAGEARGSKSERKPLRVLFLTHYFPPEGNAPASRVHEMAKRWVRDGYEVTVITSAPNSPNGILYSGYRNKLVQRDTLDGIHVIRVWTYLAANKGRIRRSLNFLTYCLTATLVGLFVRKPDVIVATSPQFFCGWAGTVVSTLRRLPFLLEIRDIWPESIAAVGVMKKRFLLRALEVFEKLMYRSATRIVTVGEGYRQQLALRGVDIEKVSVVTNGVDRELFLQNVDSAAVRERHNFKDEFVCSYVGTIGMACGLGVVARAGKILQDKGRTDIKFMLIGDGAMKEKVSRQVESNGLQNVIMTGRLDKQEIPAYLAASDACLVHLRRQELFKTVLPSKMFEAAGMGKPILLGVEGCAADFLRRANAGIAFIPEDAEALVSAVEKLADDRALAASLGADGRKYVLKHFDRDQLSRDYLDVLHSVCEEPENVEAALCA